MIDAEGFDSRIAKLAYNYEFNKISLEDYHRLKIGGLEGVESAMIHKKIFIDTIQDRIGQLKRIIEVLSFTGTLNVDATPQVVLPISVQNQMLAAENQQNSALYIY